MITPKEIEDDDYSTGDVADLMLRLQHADSFFKEISLNSTNQADRDYAKKALDTVFRDHQDVDCEVTLCSDGDYICDCGLDY